MRVVAESDSGALGTDTYRNTALKATKQVVTAVKSRVYGLHVYNQDSSDTYLQFYDALTAGVTVGTTTPKETLWIPASAGIDDNFTIPWEFNTGLIVAATATIGGSTNPTNGLLINLRYKA